MIRLSALLCVLALPAQAHEFWLSPLDYTVDSGGTVEAHLRNGENFKGGTFGYLPRNFRRFEYASDGAFSPVEGRAGDSPAASVPGLADGLVTLVHETTDTVLTYKDWQKFVSFVTHKDAPWVIDEHRARGLSETEIRERYSRYVKSLVAVGGGAGADLATGMAVEFVALANPYTDDLSGGLPVRVLYQGAPVADAQVELFDRPPEGEVVVTLHKTDADGVALLPVQPGHEYLADHVVLRALDPATDNAAWESLWAALTFMVPAR